ncbi:MAG: glutamate formimidoyltransferase [Firmicutes bacterium]|nr:glutamate formimidoyltransferase [Bacillota bacterium]
MWVESIPNFSEGQNLATLDRILQAASIEGVKVLGFEGDGDHNRSVLTIAGEGDRVVEALFRAIEVAISTIDLTQQQGTHPRLGAVDVVPLVPLGQTPMSYAIDLARQLGELVATQLKVPVYLYEQAATKPEHKNLADVRRGQFEGLIKRMKHDPPDFGGAMPHPTAGATVIGARWPLIAFNVFLNTSDLAVARAIAKAVRGSSGGLIGVKALAMDTVLRGRVQVSMNLVDYPKTTLPQAVELVRREAARFGVLLAYSELIGFLPAQAVVDAMRYYLQIPDFDASHIVELALAGEEFIPAKGISSKKRGNAFEDEKN